jgi:peptidoglycan biosynthesis protein MviN/MurJ (putative lipid II flippase)
MGAAYGLGICMVLLAIGSFILFSNLLITRSRERIQTLFLLGYSRKKLAYLMARKVLIFPIVSMLVAVPVAAWLRWNIIQDVRVFIGEVSAWPSASAILGMLCLLAVYLTVAVLDLWRQLTRIERPH